jgi:UDP-GlcNAc:undecaprenyl-phosphate GlcNAc-1-phosphate transferase
MTSAVYLLPVIALLVGFRAKAIGTRLGVMDYPGGHKTHGTPTPLVGGFAVTLPALIYSALFLWVHPESKVHAALVVCVGGAFLLGLVDDRVTLSSRLRLIAGTAIALASLAITPAFVVESFDFTFLSEAIALQPFSVVFSVLVIVGMMNAINMADGIDGLVCGLCLIWSLFLLFYAPPGIAFIVLLLAVCLLMTLLFNLGGKLFLGDSGSYSAGLAISLLTIYTYNTSGGALHADAVVAWFIVPVLDCLRLMAVRTIQRRSPTSPDTNHLHHRLQRIMPRSPAVVFYWVLVAVPGAIAIARPSLTLTAVLVVTSIYLSLLVLTSERLVIGIKKMQTLGQSRGEYRASREASAPIPNK